MALVSGQRPAHSPENVSRRGLRGGNPRAEERAAAGGGSRVHGMVPMAPAG
eukprot:NODE_28532_length_474_cov_2.922190.p7 GENE.NODE_28532_length_474_cov_2.922190~~NODE_28532_length_474_cov_2.922190.p7  ORF type:complete len:51 (+),score=2.49 NODE_28532_length_474_cov_2.922190:281-433(+)